MRRLRSPLYLVLLLCLLSAACAPLNSFLGVATSTAQPPTPTLMPVVPNTGLFANQQPNVVNKPQMALGAAYRYFDGSLLDAVPNSGPILIGVPGGSDNPQHKVTVSDFWIYSTEVSNQMYAWCVSLGKCTPPDLGDDPLFQNSATLNYPVVGVNWQQASDYCGFAHGRLPTEAEWEKAASWDAVHQTQLLFPWGNQPASCNLLNFKYCVGHATAILQYGQGRSFYGAYNMEGNVSEWVDDWYSPNYYLNSPAQDPMGPSSGSNRAIRGSAWNSDAYLASPASRLSAPPGAHSNSLGFRCVVQDPSYYAPFCTAPVSYGVNAAGGSLQQCPAPVISDQQGCGSANNTLDFVTVEGSSLTTVTVTGLEGCTPGDNSLGVQHTCPAGVTITVNTKCNNAPSSSPSCPPNYQQDPKNPLQCTSPGAPGACPAGYSYDTTLKCCSIPTGSNIPGPLCPAGQHPYNGACVLDVTGLQQPQSYTFTTGNVACVAGPLGVSVTATAARPSPTNPPTLPPPTNTPVSPTNTPFPTLPPLPTNTLVPTVPPPSATPLPTLPPFPSDTPAPTNPPLPTATLGPTDPPLPTNTPFPTHTPKPTHVPKFQATNTPAPAPTLAPAPQPTGTAGAVSPQLVTVPLSVPAQLVSNSLPPIYPSNGVKES